MWILFMWLKKANIILLIIFLKKTDIFLYEILQRRSWTTVTDIWHCAFQKNKHLF